MPDNTDIIISVPLAEIMLLEKFPGNPQVKVVLNV